MLLCVDWSKFDSTTISQLLFKSVIKRHQVSSSNFETKKFYSDLYFFFTNETNKLYERRPKEEESTELLQDDANFRHKIQRPEGFETLCRSDPACPEGCDACCKLPYHKKTGEKCVRAQLFSWYLYFLNTNSWLWFLGKLHAHQGDAENLEIWNWYMRYRVEILKSYVALNWECICINKMIKISKYISSYLEPTHAPTPVIYKPKFPICTILYFVT